MRYFISARKNVSAIMGLPRVRCALCTGFIPVLAARWQPFARRREAAVYRDHLCLSDIEVFSAAFS
jgi:hypothetical protein